MMKLLSILLVLICTAVVGQNNNIAFYHDCKIICLDKNGKEVYPSYDVCGRVKGYNYTIKKGDKFVNVYKLPGIERLLGNERDTILDINTRGALFAIVKTPDGLFVRDEKANNLPIKGYDSLGFYAPVEDSLPCIFVKKAEKYGVCDLQGKIIVPVEFNKIDVVYPLFFVVERDSLKGLINLKGKETTKIIYQEFGSLFTEGKLRFKRNNLWGFLNTEGIEIIPPFLEKEPRWFSDGFSEITLDEKYSFSDKDGLMDSTGKIILPMEYEGIYISECGITIRKKYKTGFALFDGKILLPSVYDEIRTLCDVKIIVAVKGDKRLYFKLVGNKLIPTTEPKNNSVSKSWMAVSANGKKGVKNPKGKIIVKPKYDDVTVIDSTYYIYYNSGFYGLGRCDTLKEVAKGFNSIINVPNFNAFVVSDKKKKYGVINLQGKTTIPLIYDSIVPLECRPYLYYENGKRKEYVYSRSVDVNAKVLGAEDEYYYVYKDGKMGFLDKNGNELIKCNKDTIESFVDGSALAVMGNIYELFDKKGVQLFSTTNNRVDTIKKLWPTKHSISLNGKYGILGSDGKIWSSIEFDSVKGPNYNFENEYYYAFKNGRVTVFDSIGNILTQNALKIPTYFEDGYAFSDVYGYLFSISNKEGKTIWEKKITQFSTQNAGDIPADICQLGDLEEFETYGNDWDYYFHLPLCFYNLKNLKRIEIKYSDLDSIPDAVENLKQLHYLEISSHKFDYASPKIAALKLLDTLIISSDVALPKEIKDLPNLNYLAISGCRFPAIPALKTLSIIADSLPADMEHFTSLKNLYFSPQLYNDYTESYSEKFKLIALNAIDKFSKLNTIETLVLSENSSVWAEALIESADKIKSMKRLKKIQGLGNSQYEEEFIKIFPTIEIK